MDKQVKTYDDFIMRNKKALKVGKTRLVQSCFKARFKDVFVRVLSFEVAM